MTWTPLISFFVMVVIFAIGNEVSLKSRSVIPLVFVSCTIFLIGYWLGIIPTDAVASTGMPAMLSSFVMAIMVTNLGTMMDLNQLLSEWKTVVICLLALVGLALASFTVGALLFGREYALVASAPIAGGAVASTIVGAACDEANRGDLAGFNAIVTALQFLVGLPISAFLVKSQLSDLKKSGRLASQEALTAGEKNFIPTVNRHEMFKNPPAWWTRPYPMLARLAFVAVVSYYISVFTGIPNAICWLVLGILGCQIGFLEKTTLQTGGFYGFMLLFQLSNLPKMCASVTWDAFKGMIYPIVGMLLLGAASLAIFGAIAGKLFRMPMKMAAATALCAMFGYPCTLLLSEDAVATMDATEEEKAVAKSYLLPKMLVAGFTTVTLASVAFASIIAPVIFK